MYKKKKILFIIMLLIPAMIVAGLIIYDQIYDNLLTKDMWITICVAFISYWGSAVVGYCTFLNSEHIRFIEDTKLMKDNLPEFKINDVMMSSPGNSILSQDVESKRIYWNSDWYELLSEYNGYMVKNKIYWLAVVFGRNEEIPMYNLSLATADLKSVDKLVKVEGLERRKDGNLVAMIPFEMKDLSSWQVYHNEFNICFTNMYGQDFYQSVKVDVLVDKQILKFYSAIGGVRGGKKKVCIRYNTIDNKSSSKRIKENVLATIHTRR